MIAWTKKGESMVYRGYRSIVRKDFEMPNGAIEPFDIVHGASFVTIASFTTENQALLIKQFRPGPEDFAIEFPSGQIDGEETPATAAHRELLEETGFACHELRLLKRITSPYSHLHKYCFLATGCQKIAECNLEEHEYLESLQISIDELRAMLRDPQNDAFTDIDTAYLSLDALGRL